VRIGLDLRPALSRPTGVGSYVQALAERLPSVSRDDELFFFSASWRERFPAHHRAPNVHLVDRRLPVRLLNLAWNRLGWPPLDRLVGSRLDLVHSPHPLLIPARSALRVVTVHDLYFLKHPEKTRAEVRRDYAPLVRDHARRADGVICVSEHTAAEAERLLRLPREKIAVIPNGIDPVYRQPVSPEAVDELLKRRGLPAGALLYVGSAEERKNLAGLRAACAELQRRRGEDLPPLLLVGPDLEAAFPDRSLGRVTGYLDAAEIRLLMASARLLVLPSHEEGFGLPVAQALAAGLPVVCSRGSALEEVARDAACLVDPSDPASIARGIEEVLDDPELAARKRERGLERSRDFDWDRAARDTAAFYRRLAGRRGA
jgi:glycosyltransferase involved in cell wall biosynthesis